MYINSWSEVLSVRQLLSSQNIYDYIFRDCASHQLTSPREESMAKPKANNALGIPQPPRMHHDIPACTSSSSIMLACDPHIVQGRQKRTSGEYCTEEAQHLFFHLKYWNTKDKKELSICTDFYIFKERYSTPCPKYIPMLWDLCFCQAMACLIIIIILYGTCLCLLFHTNNHIFCWIRWDNFII